MSTDLASSRGLNSSRRVQNGDFRHQCQPLKNPGAADVRGPWIQCFGTIACSGLAALRAPVFGLAAQGAHRAPDAAGTEVVALVLPVDERAGVAAAQQRR